MGNAAMELLELLKRGHDYYRRLALESMPKVQATENCRAFVLYPAARAARHAAKALVAIGIKVSAFCDSDPLKWGSNLEGIPVISPTNCGYDTPTPPS